jgi:hypothetical protein
MHVTCGRRPPARVSLHAHTQVLGICEGSKSTVHNEGVASFVVQVVEKFGAARLRLGALLDFLCGPAGLGCVQAKARAAAVGALCAVYKQMGPALRAQVETRSVSAAVMGELNAELAKVSSSPRQLAPGVAGSCLR